MAKATDTLVHLGNHAGFEDWLRYSREVMMAYLWTFPILGFTYYKIQPPFSGAFLSYILIAVSAVLVLLKALRWVVKIELVLDRERQQLLLRRKFFGFQHLVSLAGVEELWAVTSAGEVPAAPVNYWWDYVVVLITRSGQRFRGESFKKSHELAAGAANRLGDDLGIQVIPSAEGHRLKVIPGATEPRLEFKEFPLSRYDAVAVLFWAFMVFITPALALSLIFG